jgi:hypothetical protein
MTEVSHRGDVPALPAFFGDIGKENVLYPYEVVIPQELNIFSPSRSIYRKLHAILEECATSRSWQTFSKIYTSLKSQRMFWNREAGPNGKPEVVSATRVSELVDYLVQLGLLETKHERKLRYLSLTTTGRTAARQDRYNKALLEAIETRVLPDGVNLDQIRKLAFDLMDEAQIPNAFYVAEKLKSRGIRVSNEDAFKTSFLILPYTLKFRKATQDTIFPVST